MKRNIVIKLGGSLLFTENNKIILNKISEFCSILKNNKNFDKVIVVCGGGSIAREYINAVRLFKGSESLSDIFGIEVSRINSKLLIAFFQDYAFPQVPKSMEELSLALLFKKIIIMGGLQPGQSTTSVALEVAEFIGAEELVILTDVKGIFNKDPRKFKNAQLVKHLTYEQLERLILDLQEDKQAAAGEYRIFDFVSLQILKRSNIQVIVTSGKDLSEFSNFWNGEKDISGTLISKE
ncbi:MAG: UMP kinase [Promethearchaeota archaeon]|jgi:uridylate kinase